MATIFSETLTRFRKEAGFPTAYKFFHGNGGDKVLGMCYRKYLMMEKGSILPLFRHLTGFIIGLHLELNSSRGQELVTAWLKTMAGEEAFNSLLKPMLAGGAAVPALTPMHKAMEKSLAYGTYHVTPEQVAVIADGPANFRCFIALSNDCGAWTPEKLAPELRLKTAETGKALAALAAAKLLKKQKNTFRCQYADKHLVFPNMADGLAENYARIKKYQDALLASGKRFWLRSLFLRADRNNIPSLLELLGVTISSANSYSVTSKSDTSALFSLDASVTRLLDF